VYVGLIIEFFNFTVILALQALLASLALVTVMAWARMLATIPSLAWPSLIQSHQE